MKLFHLPAWLLFPGVCLCLMVPPVSGQESGGSVTVPTPSFSNPNSRAVTTEVPETGTTLRKLRPVKVPGATDPADSTEDKKTGEASPEEVKKEPKEKSRPKKSTAKKKQDTGWSETEESRRKMLERIGDQLSLRMRSLREREEAITLREKALLERERKAAEREEMISDIEASLIQREEVVRRREKLPPPQAWRGGTAPSVEAQHAAVLDGKTMQFYHAKNATESTPVASTQKLMTALIVCDAGDLDKTITIPREATEVEPTVIGIQTGEKYTRRQLLTSLLVRSGNDIAAALAIDNAGSLEAFADKMNSMGQRIGLINSNFKTPHGLPAPGQYSCARDIAVVAFEAYQNPTIRGIVRKRGFKFVFDGDRGVSEFSNTNRLLRTYEACNGMKTGFTFAAGRCLVSSAFKNGQHRIAVVIKTTNSGVWDDSRRLLEWSFGLEMLGPLTKTDPPRDSIAGGI